MAVLVLGRQTGAYAPGEKQAMVVGFDGKLSILNLEKLISFLGYFDKEINFSFGDGTDAAASCGVTFKNEFWMFGGRNEMRQVNKRNV